MYFYAHYSVHRRESIVYHVPRIYGIILAAVEANTTGNMILWRVFSALPNFFFKICTPFLAQQNENLITVNTKLI